MVKTIITKFKNLTIIFTTVSLFLAFFTNAKYISNTTIKALEFCIYSLLPSIFPYMFVSTLLSQYPPVFIELSRLNKPVSRILGICKRYASPIILGNICGFVCGPKIICESFSKFDNKNQFTKIIFLSSNAGIGYVISFIGLTLCNDFLYGIFLYFSQLALGFLISKFFFKRQENDTSVESTDKKATSFFSSFSKSLSTTTNALILICSYTILFSILISVIQLIPLLSSHPLFNSIISAILEISHGVNTSVELNSAVLGAFFIGFSVGFSGLCVIFQILSICDGYPIKKLKFITLKLLQGISLGILSSIYSYFGEICPIKAVNLTSNRITLGLIIIISIIIFFVLIKIKNKIFKFLC